MNEKFLENLELDLKKKGYKLTIGNREQILHSNSTGQTRSFIGNGWTIDVIAHIFKHIKELKK